MVAAVTSFPTPLVRLARFVPSGSVYLKAEHLQPTGSVYDRIAGAILDARRGELPPRSVAIVAGSGSLALAFAAQAPRFPIELVTVCPASTLPEHKKLLEGHKVAVVFSDASSGLAGTHARAIEEQKKRGGVILHSPVEIEAASSAFEASVGAELVEAHLELTSGGRRLSVVAPIGSGALLTGIRRAFERAKAPLDAVGAVLPRGERTSKQDGVVAEDEARQHIALAGVELVAVSDREAFETRTELARREGILIGMSSSAAVRVARGRAEHAASPGVQVAIAIDAGDRYFSVDHHFRASGGPA